MPKGNGAVKSSGTTDYRVTTDAERAANKGTFRIGTTDLGKFTRELKKIEETAPDEVAAIIKQVVDKVVTDTKAKAASSDNIATQSLAAPGVLEAWAGKRSSRAKAVRAVGGVRIIDASKTDDLWPFAGEYGVIADATRKRRSGVYKGYNASDLPVWRGNQFLIREGDSQIQVGYALSPTVAAGREMYSEMLLDGLIDMAERYSFR